MWNFPIITADRNKGGSASTAFDAICVSLVTCEELKFAGLILISLPPLRLTVAVVGCLLLFSGSDFLVYGSCSKPTAEVYIQNNNKRMTI